MYNVQYKKHACSFLAHTFFFSTFAVGMLEDLKKIGKPNIGLEVFNDDRTPTFYLDFSKRPR